MSSDTKFQNSRGDDNTNPEHPDPTTKVDVKQELGTSSSERNDGKYKRGKVIMIQGYNYTGGKDEIRVIFTLKSEKFANKVAFTTFVDKMKMF